MKTPGSSSSSDALVSSRSKKVRRRLRRLQGQQARADLVRAAEAYFCALGGTVAAGNVGRMVVAHLEGLERERVERSAEPPSPAVAPVPGSATPEEPAAPGLPEILGEGKAPRSSEALKVSEALKSSEAPREFRYPNGPLNVLNGQSVFNQSSVDAGREGVGAVVFPPLRPLIVLHRPEIPPNTGTIARLCAAFQLPLVLIGPLGFDVSEKAFRRAGLDYWPWVDLAYYDTWQNFVATIPGRRLVFVETDGATSVGTFKFQPFDVLVFGSETSGLPSAIIEEGCAAGGVTLQIPMPATQVRSINLANAVAIVASHALHRSP